MVGNLVRWTSTSVVCLLIQRTWRSIVHAAVSTPKVSCDKALVPQITMDGPLSGVLTQFVPAVVLWPEPNGNRYEHFSHRVWFAERTTTITFGSRSEPRQSGEGKSKSPLPRHVRVGERVRLCVKFRFWLSQVVARSHACSPRSRREDDLPSILGGVAVRGGTVLVHVLANGVTRISPDNAEASPFSPLPDPHMSGERGLAQPDNAQSNLEPGAMR